MQAYSQANIEASNSYLMLRGGTEAQRQSNHVSSSAPYHQQVLSGLRSVDVDVGSAKALIDVVIV